MYTHTTTKIGIKTIKSAKVSTQSVANDVIISNKIANEQINNDIYKLFSKQINVVLTFLSIFLQIQLR